MCIMLLSAVRYYLPLQQGLRQTLAVDCSESVLVRYYLPLQQGLRPKLASYL